MTPLIALIALAALLMVMLLVCAVGWSVTLEQRNRAERALCHEAWRWREAENRAARLRGRVALWQNAARRFHWRAKVSRRYADAARAALMDRKAYQAAFVRE